ncbi:hypothetical protein QUF50_04845 [Thiotrichales bacterium HSG1]|nr:hypothetical protein [Thiotrichales bacterium HSG1]
MIPTQMQLIKEVAENVTKINDSFYAVSGVGAEGKIPLVAQLHHNFLPSLNYLRTTV